MFITRNQDEGVLKIHHNNKAIFEAKFMVDEFVCIFNTDDKIEITKELDPYFYHYLDKFMDNRYLFSNHYCEKTPNRLIWLSDQCINIDNPNEVGLANRLVIEKESDVIKLSYMNPFFQKLGIKKAQHLIAFSPAGNGHWSKNIETDATMQDELIYMFKDILHEKKIEEKRKDYKNGN